MQRLRHEGSVTRCIRFGVVGNYGGRLHSPLDPAHHFRHSMWLVVDDSVDLSVE